MTRLHTTAPRYGTRLFVAMAAAFVICVLTLAPRAVVAPARSAFMGVVYDLASPLLLSLPLAEPERVLNTILFVPLGATIALLLPRRAWPIAIVAGCLLSATVEYAQESIPGRVPDPDDVLWNTVGAVIGVVAVTIPRLLVAAAARTRQRGSPTRT